jgi:adenosylmethionine-8-amino-7-oxononanoate aminotransferase
MVRRYWALKGKPEKQWVIARENAYHGSTVAGMSLGGMAPMHDQGGPGVPGITHVRQPYWFDEGRPTGQDPESFGRECAAAIEARIKELGEENVAAFIAEPVQGAGGAIIPPASYWPAVKAVLAKYDILLVVDEVICGFGRLGEWFGSLHYALEPDLMPIAKGLSSGYLPIGGETRSLGLIGALELVADKPSGARFPKRFAAGNLCRDLCYEAGLVMRSVGDTMIISPPLVISHDQIDQLVRLAWEALDATSVRLADLHPSATQESPA